MYAEIVSAIQSLKVLGDMAKAARSLSNYNEFVPAVSEASTKLINATAVALASQEKQAAFSSEIAELKDKLRNLERFEHEAKRYALIELPLGGFVFSLKKGIKNDQPQHYLCATCMNKKEITILQPDGGLFISCPFNHGRIQVKKPDLTPYNQNP